MLFIISNLDTSIGRGKGFVLKHKNNFFKAASGTELYHPLIS